jgi:hypothetical protein
MTPPPQGQAMPGAKPPSQTGLASGGVIRFQFGGANEDEDGEGEDEYEDYGEGEDQPKMSSQGSADRAMEPEPEVSSRGSADRAMQPVNVDDLAESMIQFEGSRKPTSPGFHANNPGHLKYAGQHGSIGKDALGFARFNDWNTGLTAMKDQIRKNLGRGLTLNEMIGGKAGVYPGWAPASDNNNTANYVNYLKKQTGYDPDTIMQEGNAPKVKSQPVLAATAADTRPATGSADTTPLPPEQTATDQTGTGVPATTTDQTTDQTTAQPADQGTTPITTFEATGHPGRIHQNITDIEAQKTALQDRIGKLPDPYSASSDYLTHLSQQADTRAATINQLQGEILQRYHKPSPWDFLSNIAAGMGASKSLSLPLMFGEGVGLATKRQDEQQQQQISDYDALEKMRQGLYTGVETERGRLLEHQATIQQANRKLLEDQLTKLNTEQDKWKQKLIPTNKLEPLSNKDDYPSEDFERALTLQANAHGWNKDRQNMERNAIQALAARGDQWQPGGVYGSAYDQFLAKYPKEANTLDAKASKYSPEDIASYAKGVNVAPGGLFDAKVVPKDAQNDVRRYMLTNGMRIPVKPPNKMLADQAALGGLTLMHADRVGNWAQDPWMQKNVFGPWMGRVEKGEEKIGMDALPIPGNATQQQTRDAQDLLTSLEYLRMREGKGLLGGRPAAQLMHDLRVSSPNVSMTVNRFLGSLDGLRASAKMAVDYDKEYMYGGHPIAGVPMGGRTATDKSGRQIVQAAPGRPWFYMDSGEEVQKKQP